MERCHRRRLPKAVRNVRTSENRFRIELLGTDEILWSCSCDTALHQTNVGCCTTSKRSLKCFCLNWTRKIFSCIIDKRLRLINICGFPRQSCIKLLADEPFSALCHVSGAAVVAAWRWNIKTAQAQFFLLNLTRRDDVLLPPQKELNLNLFSFLAPLCQPESIIIPSTPFQQTSMFVYNSVRCSFLRQSQSNKSRLLSMCQNLLNKVLRILAPHHKPLRAAPFRSSILSFVFCIVPVCSM